MKSASLFALVLFSQFSYAAIQEINVVPNKGKVEFEAIGRPSMLKIKGQSEVLSAKFKVEGNILSGEAQLKLETMKTGIELRDKHMTEKYLETAKHPDAVLTISALTLPKGWDAKDGKVKDLNFTGKLKLHGVEKEISGKINLENAKSTATADFEIAITDYGVEIPSYLGVKVADKVKVKVSLNDLNLQAK